MSDCRFGVSPVNYPDPDPDLKACLQNKGVVRRLFGSILISYTSEVS